MQICETKKTQVVRSRSLLQEIVFPEFIPIYRLPFLLLHEQSNGTTAISKKVV